jgi:hypothetical protein
MRECACTVAAVVNHARRTARDRDRDRDCDCDRDRDRVDLLERLVTGPDEDALMALRQLEGLDPQVTVLVDIGMVVGGWPVSDGLTAFRPTDRQTGNERAISSTPSAIDGGPPCRGDTSGIASGHPTRHSELVSAWELASRRRCTFRTAHRRCAPWRGDAA